MIKRRTLIAALGGTAAAWPLAAGAQQDRRQYRLGVVTLSARVEPLYDQLARAGFVEGKNLVVDHVPTTPQDLAARVAAVLATRPDAIFAGGDGPAHAVLQATKTVPIVAISDNLLSSGLLASFARPDGNLTGVSIFGNELNGKRQELLIELVPGLKRLAILADPASTTPDQTEAMTKAAVAHGIECATFRVATPAEILPAVDAARAGGAQGLNVLASPLFHSRHKELIDRVAVVGLPAIFQWPEYVEEGALVGYGPRLEYIYRRLIARLLVKVLRGAKPADIPAEQPTDFELGINLKAAKALGLEVPPTLVARADEVIE